MNFFKKHPSSQSTIELAVVSVLVLVAITAMGPYAIRSVNSYMRSWERRADQGQIDVNIIAPPGTPPEIEITCGDIDCEALYSNSSDCKADPLECCIWVKEFAGEEHLCLAIDPPTGVCRKRTFPDNSGLPTPTNPDPNPGDGCIGTPCCGGEQWFWDNTPMNIAEDECDNKWACTIAPDDCQYCDVNPVTNKAECNSECNNNSEGCDCPDCNPPDDPQYDGNGCENDDGFCFWKEEYDSDRCCGYFDEDACPLPDCGVHKTAEECCDDWKDRCVWYKDYHESTCQGTPAQKCVSKTYGAAMCDYQNFSECCCIRTDGDVPSTCPDCKPN